MLKKSVVPKRSTLCGGGGSVPELGSWSTVVRNLSKNDTIDDELDLPSMRLTPCNMAPDSVPLKPHGFWQTLYPSY